jgi:FkbM family methyltransferase
MTSQQKTLIYCPNPITIIQPPPPCFLLRHPNNTTTEIVRYGLPEQSLIDWSRQFCRTDQIMLDIGAHCGMYALSLAPHCKAVHAFECQRETYYQLCGGIALNAAWNITAHQVALGEEVNTTKPLYIVSLDGGGSSVSISPNSPMETALVYSTTLDAYNLSEVGFIKIDAEGSEEAILRGATLTLERNNYPPILYESWNGEEHAAKSESLHTYLTKVLRYTVVPITGYAHMKLAVQQNS